MKKNGAVKTWGVAGVLLLLLLLARPVAAFSLAGEWTVVNSTESLKEALEDPLGSRVKLGADLTFSPTLGRDYAIEMVGGEHLLDLNGHHITYTYVNSMREHSGVPIRQNGHLTIQGEGSITGGYVAVENSGQEATLLIRGGNYRGQAATALRVMGLTVIEGGSFQGRFGDVWLEAGVLVDRALAIDSIDYTFNRGGIVVKNGVLSGSATLRAFVDVEDLSIKEGATLTLGQHGALVVRGSLAGEERIAFDGGMLIKDGRIFNQGNFSLAGSFDFDTLYVPRGVELMVMDHHTLKVTSLENHGKVFVRSGARLEVLGDLINEGQVELQALDQLTVHGQTLGGGNLSAQGQVSIHPENEDLAPEKDLGRMTRAAGDLYALGLFKGTGLDSQGRPIFDLVKEPTRQVAMTMLVRLLGKEEEALSRDWQHPFNDVDSWAVPYVGYAYAQGLTKGTGETTFGGSDLITAHQYLTLTLRALGYDDSQGDFSWQAPTVLSEKLTLTEGDYRDNSAAFYRGDIAVISQMALQREIKDGPMLIEHLVDLGAVSVEHVHDIGWRHLLHHH